MCTNKPHFFSQTCKSDSPNSLKHTKWDKDAETGESTKAELPTWLSNEGYEAQLGKLRGKGGDWLRKQWEQSRSNQADAGQVWGETPKYSRRRNANTELKTTSAKNKKKQTVDIHCIYVFFCITYDTGGVKSTKLNRKQQPWQLVVPLAKLL